LRYAPFRRITGIEEHMTNEVSIEQRLRRRLRLTHDRLLEEAADELDRLSRIEDKYNNLCPVLNEQAGEIQELKEELLRWKSKNGE